MSLNLPQCWTPRSPSETSSSPKSSRNVYIRHLSICTNDSTLHSLAAQFGSPTSVRAILELDPSVVLPNVLRKHSVQSGMSEGIGSGRGRCKGIGFVLFETEAEAERAIEGLNEQGYDASYARESPSTKLRSLADKSSTNLYLTNLPIEWGEAQLIGLFEPPATVQSARLLRNSDTLDSPSFVLGDSRGIGFVRLSTRKEAVEAIARLSNLHLPGRDLGLQIRFADTELQKRYKSKIREPLVLDGLERRSSLGEVRVGGDHHVAGVEVIRSSGGGGRGESNPGTGGVGESYSVADRRGRDRTKSDEIGGNFLSNALGAMTFEQYPLTPPWSPVIPSSSPTAFNFSPPPSPIYVRSTVSLDRLPPLPKLRHPPLQQSLYASATYGQAYNRSLSLEPKRFDPPCSGRSL